MYCISYPFGVLCLRLCQCTEGSLHGALLRGHTADGVCHQTGPAPVSRLHRVPASERRLWVSQWKTTSVHLVTVGHVSVDAYLLKHRLGTGGQLPEPPKSGYAEGVQHYDFHTLNNKGNQGWFTAALSLMLTQSPPGNTGRHNSISMKLGVATN